MSQITPLDGGTLTDHQLRRGVMSHRKSQWFPGINQYNQDTVEGLGSADSEEDE